MSASTCFEVGVDPRAVPHRTLYTGARMPAVGLGTFGSDHISGDAVAGKVQEAISSFQGQQVSLGSILGF